MKVSRFQTLILLLISPSLFACVADGQTPQDQAHKIAVITLQKRTVTLTQQYVCQIHALHHIEVRTPAEGYVASILVKVGQAVKQSDLLFEIMPLVDKQKPDAENGDKAVSIKAPFDGLVGRLPRQRGSLVLKGETLTTLSDNSLMWAVFRVPEARYLEYMSHNLGQDRDVQKIELVLANGNKYDQPGKLGAIEAEFDAGNIAFRADFPNPERLLRHGQTGTVLISHVQNDAILIPQRATLEALNKRYVYVVDKDDVAHRREIVVQNEVEDQFVVRTGLGVGEKIVVEGVRQVRDGDKVEYEERQPKPASVSGSP
jgi:membrane fusion protein (multidrug efflux system)